MMRHWPALAALMIVPTLVGCTVYEDERFEAEDVPGETPWNHDPDVKCTDIADCGDGEVCDDGICQMARCLDAVASVPPMGQNKYFGTDGEIAIISDDSYVDGFESYTGDYVSSWDLQGSSGKVLDVAAGNLTGSKPHSIAVAVEFSEELVINGPDGVFTLDIGMWPQALAVGDVDGDEMDEVIAFAVDGSIAVCDVDEKWCNAANLEGVTGKDVAVADVDGDGYQEALFLFDHEDESELIVWNLDAEINEQEVSYGWRFNFPVRAMASGIFVANTGAQVVLLEDGGWWGWSNDKLHVFAPGSEEFVANVDVDGHTLDVAAGDRNSDEIAEIAILREDHNYEILEMDGATVSSVSVQPISVGTTAQRISFVDWDGDSATGELIEGPELIAGKAVPIAALMFPPYPHGAAVGALSANITLGDVESVDETMSDTLSLSAGLALSFGAEAFGFKAKVGGYINTSTSWKKSVNSSMTIGARYWILAQRDLHGTAYAPVIMSCGCYHRYKYITDDPSGILGGDGQTVDIFVPVGGQTQLWSSNRYNAMAEATGTLPKIEIPITIGDVDSYPNEVLTQDGEKIHPDDLLFPQVPTYQISDVGFVTFWLARGESVSNETAESITLGVKSSLGGGVVSVDSNIDLTWTQGYSIRVGKDQIFAGGVPPVPDNPDTPEDEYELYKYSFQPNVYRHHYIDSDGEDAGYYVMNFAVGK